MRTRGIRTAYVFRVTQRSWWREDRVLWIYFCPQQYWRSLDRDSELTDEMIDLAIKERAEDLFSQYGTDVEVFAPYAVCTAPEPYYFRRGEPS